MDERELRGLRSAIRTHVAGAAELESDEHAVELIVGELFGNVQRYAPGPFCAELHWHRDSLQVSVHDPGPCFAPDAVSVTGPADWEAERGRGIAIMKALGGTVETELTDGEGCRVSVTLPVATSAHARTAPQACPHGHPAEQGRHCPRIARFLAARGAGQAPALARSREGGD